MNLSKQKLLIEYLISSPDTFAICQGIVKSDYFDPELRNLVKFTKDYFEEYSTTPNPTVIKAETDIELSLHTITHDQIKYCSQEIEKFCKRRAIEKAVLAAPALIQKGDFGSIESTIKDAILVSLHKNIGLRYFSDPEDRLLQMSKDNFVHSTGWAQVDEALFGGLARKELLLVSANSGGGKSITLANLAANYVEQGLNVLYISLELSEYIVSQRFDTMFTGISRKDWKNHIDEISIGVKNKGKKSGILDIIQMPSGTTANDIKAYLKEFYLHHNMLPDMLILDYLDKMSPNEKVSADNVFVKDKLCSEQLRDIGVEMNMIIATASQLNRDAVKSTEHNHSHIAGGISKINEADVYWSILLNDVMKAKGEIAFNFQKTRNSDGVGKTIHLKWDSKYLRILDNVEQQTSTDLVFKPKTGGKLADLISSFGDDE